MVVRMTEDTGSIDTVAVLGSGRIEDRHLMVDVLQTVESEWDPTTYVHGGGDGVESLVQRVIGDNPFPPNKPVVSHPIPEWVGEMVGDGAGIMRDEYVLDGADAVVFVVDPDTIPTQRVKMAEVNGLLVRQIECTGSGDDWTIESDRTYDERDQAQLGDF